ncbi:MAG TPA: FliM/FliN family flagellar motor switch protein [Sphingomonadaceae bacterium]|nr:FliM/FliN family flagellar motor switch protein [Sphingomonadaceae bacterium]
MNAAPVLWLPNDALLDARTADPVARCLQEWAGQWFAAARPCLPPRWEKLAQGAAALGFASIYEGRGFRLALHEEGRLALASQLLGRNLAEDDLRTPQDRAVIVSLVEKSLAALGSLLDSALPEGNSAEGFALPVTSADGELLLRIEAGAGLLALLVRNWAGSSRKRAPLGLRNTALEPQPLRLDARLGFSRLALAEVETLAVGDVLALDTPLAAPLDALIDNLPAAIGALALVPGESGFQFQLTRPATQW